MSKRRPQQLSLLSFFTSAPRPAQQPKEREYLVERSIDKPHVRVRIPVRLKNTERHFNHVQRDLEKRLTLELASNVDSAVSSKGKGDREWAELCERMRARKEHCRAVLYDLLNL